MPRCWSCIGKASPASPSLGPLDLWTLKFCRFSALSIPASKQNDQDRFASVSARDSSKLHFQCANFVTQILSLKGALDRSLDSPSFPAATPGPQHLAPSTWPAPRIARSPRWQKISDIPNALKAKNGRLYCLRYVRMGVQGRMCVRQPGCPTHRPRRLIAMRRQSSRPRGFFKEPRGLHNHQAQACWTAGVRSVRSCPASSRKRILPLATS